MSTPPTSSVLDANNSSLSVQKTWQETASVNDVQYVVDGDPDENLVPAGAHLAPPAPRDLVPSPQPSYYSVSDLPPSSPLPSPQYLFYSPEISSNVTPVSARTPRSTQPLQPSHELVRKEAENRIRSPPSAFPLRMQTLAQPRSASRASDHPRAASRASETSRYATASEGEWDDEDDHSVVNHERPGSTYSTSPRAL